MKKSGALKLLTVALILGTGLGTVWGFGLGAIITLLLDRMRIDYDYEEILVDADGTPFIQTRLASDYNNRMFRTISGETVERSSDSLINSTWMNEPYRRPRLAEWPISWEARIAGIGSFGSDPVSWTMLRDGRRPGQAYIVGYDRMTSQLAGYIGRNGFRTSMPPADEQFNLGNLTFDTANVWAVMGFIRRGGLGGTNRDTGFSARKILQPWFIYLVDGDTIQEINLRTREVRPIKEFPGLVGIQIAHPTSSSEPNAEGVRSITKLFVRTEDALSLYDVFTGQETRFQLPTELVNKPFGVTMAGPESMMLHVGRGKWERGQVMELMTINPTGEATRRDTVKLVLFVSPDTPYIALIPACIVPVLVGWLGGMFLIGPIVQLQNLSVPTFSEGMQEAWNIAWMGLLAVFVLSVILTTITYRWQRKYSRPNTALWTAFVFLTTLPGFLAYWVMHQREPMGACQHCGANIPLDRDICAKCATPLPAPKLLGTEIFA